MNQLSEILKELKKIEPHPHFTQHSRMRVLNTPKMAVPMHIARLPWTEHLFNRLSSPSAVFAAFTMVVILSSALYLQHKTAPYLAVIRVNSSDREKEELAIKINLSEIVSYEQAEQMIQVALRAAAQQARQQENTASAPRDAVPATPINHEIDKALELML